jgi:hypothetical protein
MLRPASQSRHFAFGLARPLTERRITANPNPEANAPQASVPPNFVNLPKHQIRVMVSADLDKLGGHLHYPFHHTWARLPRRHQLADPCPEDTP